MSATGTTRTASSRADPPARVARSGDRVLDHAFVAVALLGLVALLVRMTVWAAKPLANGDTWFHLRIGHELWGPWSLAHPGSLSRFGTVTWVPTQWASQMLMAKVEDWFGLPGVAWLFGLAYVGFVLAVYACCRRAADPVVATLATGAAVIGAADVLSARPQVFSLILFAVAVAAWRSALETHRPPWWLVPLTWGWACVHGLWSAGVVLGLVAVIGAVLDAPRGRRPWRMLLVPAASAVAACLTPVGPRLLLSQVAVSSRAAWVSEWQPTSFRSPSALMVAVMAGVLLLVLARRGRTSWSTVLLLLTACGWAALVTRMLAFAAVLLAPLLAEALAALRARPTTRGQVRAERVTVLVAVVGLLALLAAVVPRTAQSPAGVPAGLAGRLGALPAGSVVLVEDTTGSWIEWRFPRLQATVDGMFDAFPVDHLRRVSEFRTVQPGWRRFVADAHPTAAVMLAGSPASLALHERLHWRVVAHDRAWVYLVPAEDAGS